MPLPLRDQRADPGGRVERAENGGLPSARVAESARSGRYLSLLERQRIATLRRDGPGVRAIAARLGRSRPRSAASCGGTRGRTTMAATTATWHTPASGNVPGARAAAGCWPIRHYAPRSSPSSRWTGLIWRYCPGFRLPGTAPRGVLEPVMPAFSSHARPEGLSCAVGGVPWLGLRHRGLDIVVTLR